ncbi:chemotaxis protein CheB (plasmid) [Deinococcus radiomollis]|uniref:chemotaxis protein CheB n=1 Tax=Deinococcus radiomollis TaxID=468916 RepID=UPI0038921673
MPSNPVVVIGGSAGALEALLRIVAQLPPMFSAPIVIVIHSDPDSPSSLPEILSRAGPLPAHHARSGEPMLGGHLYLAPPDQHLLVDGELLVLSHEPKEHRSRLSIDVTMRSAAATRGESVIGVLLSGLLDDGTSGLWSIQEQGGRILVQDPEEALFPSMPRSALQRVHADGILPSTEIAGRLEQLVHDWTSIQEVTPLEQGDIDARRRSRAVLRTQR